MGEQKRNEWTEKEQNMTHFPNHENLEVKRSSNPEAFFDYL